MKHRFEHWCFESNASVSYDTLTQLYDDPERLDDILSDEHLRKKARSCIQQALHHEYVSVYTSCTIQAQQLASRFSSSDFVNKLLPESSVLEAFKKIIVPAVKMIMWFCFWLECIFEQFSPWCNA